MFSYYPERLEERFLLAGTPTLVADLNTSGRSSWPSGFTVFQNAVYYSAFDDQHGRELWKYDGTSATRATDIVPGPARNPTVEPVEFADFHFVLYFGADHPATRFELWR